MGSDRETERAADLQPDRYYLLGDAGSFFFFEPDGDNVGGAGAGLSPGLWALVHQFVLSFAVELISAAATKRS